MRAQAIKSRLLAPLVSLALGALGAGCSSTSDPSGFDQGGGGPGPGGEGGTGGAMTSSSGQGGFNLGGNAVGGGSGGSEPTCTPLGADDDVDQDGYTPNQGDCDDCDDAANPNAVEVQTPENADPHDEDCDGDLDEIDPPCDASMAVDEMDPLVAIQAAELCKMSSGPGDWGVVEAKWTMADGSAPPMQTAFHLGHGVLTAFGPNVDVRKGAHMLGLSSGSARQPNDPGYQDVGGFDKQYTGVHPQGFPKESQACPGVVTGQPHDPTGVEITIRTPSNAHGFSFDFDFYTYEWPGYICSQYNDFFVAILDPIPAMQMDGNISFDSQGNPVSVNNSLLEVCGCPGNPPNACSAGGKSFPCALGNVELIGTGFGFDTGYSDHGATSWLQTKAPVPSNSEIKIRWAVYDSGDGVLDSTTLIDNWQWIADPGTTVGTDPVPK